MVRYFIIFSHADNRAVVQVSGQTQFDKTTAGDPVLSEAEGKFELALPPDAASFPIGFKIEGYNGEYGPGYRGGGHQRDPSPVHLTYKIVARDMDAAGNVLSEGAIYTISVYNALTPANALFYHQAFTVSKNAVTGLSPLLWIRHRVLRNIIRNILQGE